MSEKALVLAGGGSRGAFQAPVIDKLIEEGIEFDHVFGVSVGSINGAVASLKKSNLTNLWKEVKRHNVFGGPASKYGFPGKAFQMLKILVGKENSLYKNKALKSLLKKHYDPSKTKVPFTFGSTSLKDGEFHTFSITPPDLKYSKSLNKHYSKDKVLDYLISSSSIPVLLPPLFGEYVDGGLKNMAPIQAAIERGVDEVIIVPTEQIYHKGDDYESIYSPDIFGIGRVSLNIILDETLQNDYKITKKINKLIKQAEEQGVELKKEDGTPYKKVKMHVIQPDKYLGNAVDFGEQTIQKRIDLGRKKIEDFLKNY